MPFLYSSMCTRAFAAAATVSLRAGIVEFCMLGGMLSITKNDIKVCPNSLLPEPFGPKRSRMGHERAVSYTHKYKEKDEQRADYGKYKLYAQVGDPRMSAPMTKEDQSAFFDRVTTPAALVEKLSLIHIFSKADADAWSDGCSSKYAISGSVISTVSRL